MVISRRAFFTAARTARKMTWASLARTPAGKYLNTSVAEFCSGTSDLVSCCPEIGRQSDTTSASGGAGECDRTMSAEFTTPVDAALTVQSRRLLDAAARLPTPRLAL